jgi:hypothetical protein
MAWAELGEEMVAGQFDEAVGLLAELKATGIRLLSQQLRASRFTVRSARFPFMACRYLG